MKIVKGMPTGIKDHSGMELKEGDVIKHPNQDQTGVVTWNPAREIWGVKYGDDPHLASLGLQVGERGMVVRVGTIHENEPEEPVLPMIWERVGPDTKFVEDERVLVCLKDQGHVYDCNWRVDGNGMPWDRDVKEFFLARQLDGHENTIEFNLLEADWVARVTFPKD